MSATTEEDEIRAVLDSLGRSIREKNASGVIAPLSDDAVTFDLAPPLRVEPSEVHDTRALEGWFATWRSPISIESRDVRIVIGGDVAYAYGLQHMTGIKNDGSEVDMWFRATTCFAREQGRWRITHMHNSVPFAMDGSGRALLDLKPN